MRPHEGWYSVVIPVVDLLQLSDLPLELSGARLRLRDPVLTVGNVALHLVDLALPEADAVYQTFNLGVVVPKIPCYPLRKLHAVARVGSWFHVMPLS
jgi:hypothetical protein